MKKVIDLSKHNEGEKFSFTFIMLALVLTLIEQTFGDTYLKGYATLLEYPIILCLLIGIFSYKSTYPTIQKRFAIVIIYMLLVGVIMGLNGIGIMLDQDMKYVMLLFAGSIFSLNEKNMAVFHSIMKVIGIIAIVAGIYAFFSFDMTYDALLHREGTWSQNYYYWWISNACFTYWGYYILFKKEDRIIGLGVVAVYFILGMMFLKRSALLDVGIIALFYMMMNKGNKVKSLVTALFFSIAILAIMRFVLPEVFNEVFDLLFERFDNTVEEETRTTEIRNYFTKEASIFQLLFGNGIGHYHIGYGWAETDLYRMRGLHVGICNLVYKGGVILPLFYLSLVIQLFKRFFRQPKKPLAMVCFGCAFSYMVSLCYGGGWTYTIIPFCIGAPLFYAANYIYSENAD